MSYIVMLASSLKTTHIVVLALKKFMFNHTCYGNKGDKTMSYIVMLALKNHKTSSYIVMLATIIGNQLTRCVVMP